MGNGRLDYGTIAGNHDKRNRNLGGVNGVKNNVGRGVVSWAVILRS